MNISDKFPSIILPNFRMFQPHVMKKDQNYGCIIGWCDQGGSRIEKKDLGSIFFFP